MCYALDCQEIWCDRSWLKAKDTGLKGRVKSTYDAMALDLKKQIQNKEVTINKLEEKLSITFVDRILFESGRTKITPQGKKILKKVGDILKNVEGRRIQVVGHTDNKPILPEYRYRIPSIGSYLPFELQLLFDSYKKISG
jgi:flagellar motor protein MotB